MSHEINGSEGCMMYHLHYVGGPDDGVVANAFKPYFEMNGPNGKYRAKEEPPDHEIWVDDFTRAIYLHYEGV